MAIPGRWFITPHAVRRYQDRVQSVPYEVALAELVRLSLRAHMVRQLHADGTELWRGPKPLRLRFIVGVSSGGALPQLLTVIH